VKRFVLAYHSHRVLGDDYARNDHVALATDLRVIHDAGARVVPLDAIVDAIDRPHRATTGDVLAEVALTFDDGPRYDFADFTHPELGAQRGFANILREFAARQPLHATSFVIASPDARQNMESTYDPAHSYVGAGALRDDWWNTAIDSGLLSIANHSWDHLHERLPRVAHSAQARGDFSRVETEDDADAQIAAAGDYIRARTRNRMAPWFAYPFGHYNAFLTREYLPRNAARLGLRAAFSTDARPVDVQTDRWCIPRYVCGHHWTNPDALHAILTGIRGQAVFSSGARHA
jgi:peptidoglycan/xylan/chitin deacetylase (PgdA/CDA1 family)